jgi:hypothetical protein
MAALEPRYNNSYPALHGAELLSKGVRKIMEEADIDGVSNMVAMRQFCTLMNDLTQS